MPSIRALRPGDRVFPLLVAGGGLYVVARMEVERLVFSDEFVVERLQIVRPPLTMWDQLFAELKRTRPSVGHRVPTTCADLAAVGTSGSEIRFDRRVSEKDLVTIRLGPKSGHEQPLTGIVESQLKNSFSLRGHLRRLSTDSAEVLAGLIDGPYEPRCAV